MSAPPLSWKSRPRVIETHPKFETPMIIGIVFGSLILILVLVYLIHKFFFSNPAAAAPDLPHSPPPAPRRGVDDAIIESFAVSSYGSGLPDEENHCSICYDDFESGQLIMTLPGCHHSFHASCIRSWFARQTTCPICRQDYSGYPVAAHPEPEIELQPVVPIVE